MLLIAYCFSLFCSLSSGRILSKTLEYFTLASTQAARGAAATEARFADFWSNESLFIPISLSTACRFSVCIRLASNDLQNVWMLDVAQMCRDTHRMSSFTPRLAKNVFMLFHEVSWVPISFKTPSRMSRIISGGARKDRISDRDSVFMFPTAARAS